MYKVRYSSQNLITGIRSFLKEMLTREVFPSLPEDFFKRNGIYILAGIVLFIAALCLRSWDNLSHPGLYVEDALLFNRYHNGNQPFSMVFNKFPGYIAFIGNFYAWMVSVVDVRVQPELYLLFGEVMGITTTISLIFSGLFKSRTIILVSPIVLGLLGMNHIFYYITITYQMYTAVLLLLCLMFYPAPRTKYGMVGMSILFCVLPWAGPYSILAIPVGIFFLLFFRDKKKQLLIGISIISTLIYYSTVNSHTTMLENIFDGKVIAYFYEVLFKDIFFLGYLGDPNILKTIGFLIFLIVIFYLQRKDKICFKLSLLLLIIAIGSLVPYFLSIKVHYNKCGACYKFISYFFWIAFILYNFDIFLLKYKSKIIELFIVLLLLTPVVIDTYSSGKKKIQINNGIAEFVETIHFYQNKESDMKRHNVYIKLQLENTYAGFKPKAIIGSRKNDAVQVGIDYFQQKYGGQFFINVPKNNKKQKK